MNWMTSAACIALLGTLAACETTPAPTVETAPVADAAETVSKDAPKTGLSNIQVIETSDGYSAWLVTEPSIPIISINMAWKGGETSDPIGKEGATSLMTYMMNEGGGDLDSKAYATRMEELNMSFGCSTGNDWTSCSMSTLSENLEPAMELVRLGLIETRFDEAPYTRAVEETLVSLKQSETSAGTIARKALYEAIYPDHPYAKYGTEESVLAISIDDLIAQRDAIMTKDTLLVTAVGDVSPDRLKSVMEMTFADLPEESQVQPLDDVILKAPVTDPIVKELDQPQSLVVFTAPGLLRDDPDFFTAYVVNYILGGGGFSARLMDEIREKEGLTYGIYTGLYAQDHLGVWSGSSQTRNESAGELIGRTQAELHKLATDGPTEKELADAKSYLTGAYPLSFDSNSKIARAMMGIRQDNLGLDYIATRNDKVMAVTMEDVKRVAAEYLEPENFTFVVVGQPEGLDELDKWFEAGLSGTEDVTEAAE